MGKAHAEMADVKARETQLHAPESEVRHLTDDERKAFSPEEAERIEGVSSPLILCFFP